MLSVVAIKQASSSSQQTRALSLHRGSSSRRSSSCRMLASKRVSSSPCNCCCCCCCCLGLLTHSSVGVFHFYHHNIASLFTTHTVGIPRARSTTIHVPVHHFNEWCVGMCQCGAAMNELATTWAGRYVKNNNNVGGKLRFNDNFLRSAELYP